MEAKELQIGDWVTSKKWIDNPFHLTRINDNGKFYYGVTVNNSQVGPFFIDELCPISITPEILTRNGFTLKFDGWLWCAEDDVEYQNYIFIQFRRGGEDGFGIRKCEINLTNKAHACFREIQYVHQLQQAMRLCGISKEIEL